MPSTFFGSSWRASVVLVSLLIVACAPEVGGERWCAMLKEKPKGDWTIREVADYAKACIVKISTPIVEPEIGSDGWCKTMKAKSKGDWTANEAADFASNCLFK